MKKLTAFLLAVIMALGCLSVNVGAISSSEGLDRLRKEFRGGKATLDYVYFSPVKQETDSTVYPLVVWLHGNASGDYDGHQLNNCLIALWASDEYQARFLDGAGAFIFLPRDPTSDIGLAWDGKTEELKSTIDAFVKENEKHIDKNRIYIGGYSMGGKGAIKAASKYAGYFAAVFPMSPVYNPSDSEWALLANTPIWLFTCKNDTYPQLLHSTVKSNWEGLKNITFIPEKCRWSVFDTLYYPDMAPITGSLKNHDTWDAVTYDLFMNTGEEYVEMTTTDATGKKINFTYPNGFINWLSSQRLNESTGEGAYRSFLQKIVDFFKNIIDVILGLFL